MASGKVVTLATRKGGSGKSTTAMNLARALELLGLKVQLVDLDHDNQSAYSWFNNWGERAKLVDDPNPAPAPLPPTVLLPGTNVEGPILDLTRTNDIVVVDAGAGSPRQNVSAMNVTDLLLIPIAPSHMDVQSSMLFMREVANQQAMNRGRPAARAVLNRVEAKKSSAVDLVEFFAEGRSPIPALTTIIPARESLSKMVAAGVTCYDFPHGWDLRPLYTRMAGEVLEILQQLQPAAGGIAQSNSVAAGR